MTNRPSFYQQLARWGRAERQQPPHNDQLRENFVAHFQPVSSSGRPALPGRPWLALALTGLAAFVFIITSNPGQVLRTSFRPISTVNNGSLFFPSKSPSSAEAPASDRLQPTRPDSGGAANDAVIPESFNLGANYDVQSSLPSFLKGLRPDSYPYPGQTPEVPITDSREFLKTDYHATVRTRQVAELTRRVQTIVRGFGGRIDGTTSTPEQGYVTFVVPKSQFEAFRAEVADLVWTRFFVEQTYSENLLPQKQNLEQQGQNIEKMLAQLNTDKTELTSTHNRTVATFRAQLNAINKELIILAAEKSDDPLRISAIATRRQALERQRSVVTTRLARENSTYSNELSFLEARIRNTEDSKAQNVRQNQEVLDTVATVRGTIAISWISLWNIIGLYLPPYWPSLVLLGAAVIAYGLYRQRVTLDLL